jgi:DNA-binding transcriptional ArsR family regulator
MQAVVEREDVFRAVADGTRRALIELLAGGELSVGDLVSHFEISQPAVSQQLRILRDSGLVSARREGRQRLYRLEAAPLRELHDWAAHYEKFWSDGLTRLGRYLERK